MDKFQKQFIPIMEEVDLLHRNQRQIQQRLTYQTISEHKVHNTTIMSITYIKLNRKS